MPTWRRATGHGACSTPPQQGSGWPSSSWTVSPLPSICDRSTRRAGDFPQIMTTFGIGASVKRREDARLVTGQGRYAEDCNAPDQVHAAFVRSPHAHADVVAIDVAPARTVAGVVAVFTGHDLRADGVGPIPTLIAERGGGIRNRDGSPFAEPAWHALATDRVRHVGEPVAVVIASTAAAARD